MNRLEVFLRDRTVEATLDGNTRLRLGDEPRVPYRSAQAAISTALEGASAHFNVTVRDFLGGLAHGQVVLSIAGERREVAVAKLHLRLAYAAESAALDRVRLVVEDAGPSIYDTFGFASDSVVIEAAGRLLDCWTRALAGSDVELSRWGTSEPKLRDGLGMVNGKVRPARIGVVGVTGAGKSSFINALLGRELLPTDIGISTAAIIEVVAAKARSSEGLKVRWMTQAMLEERIRELRAGAKRLLSEDENDRRLRRLDALERAQRLRGRSDLLNLDSIKEYASVRQGGLADAVERVTAFVHHPLLEHATIVDTPGLRDPDPWRRRVAIGAVGQMDAWVYLAQAGDKESSSVVDDWRELRSQSNNGACVMLLTKMDALGGDEERILSARLSAFRQHGWDRDVEHCAARGPSLLAATAGSWQSRLDRLEDSGYPLYLARAVAPGRRPKAFEGALREFADAGDEQVVRDYVLDASGVPACARFVGRGLVELALRGRAATVQARLGEEVRACRSRLEAVLAAERTVLEKSDSLEKLRDAREKASSELASEQAALSARRARMDRLREQWLAEVTNLVANIHGTASELLPRALRELSGAVVSALVRFRRNLTNSAPADHSRSSLPFRSVTT